MKLQTAIYEMMCDTNLFPVDSSYYSKDVQQIILDNADELYKNYPDAVEEKIRHRVRHLLQVHKNTNVNKYFDEYKHKRVIDVDMSNPKRYIYTFR